jgi:hypothetical protein
MKSPKLINFSYLILVLFASCSNSKLDMEQVYDTTLSSVSIDVASEGEKILTKNLKISFILFEKENDIDLLEQPKINFYIESDDQIYSMTGTYTYFKGNSYLGEQYSISIKGIDNTFLTVKLITENEELKGTKGAIDTPFDNYSSNYKKSKIPIEEFEENYKKGLNNQFFPLLISQKTPFIEFPDYWLSYFEKQEVLDQRLDLRKLKIEKEQKKINRSNELARQKEAKSRRKNHLCALIKKYNKDDYKMYQGTKYVSRNTYIPKSKLSYGYIDKKGLVEDNNGKSYTGPITLIQDKGLEIYIGLFQTNSYPDRGILKFKPFNIENYLVGMLDKCSE